MKMSIKLGVGAIRLYFWEAQVSRQLSTALMHECEKQSFKFSEIGGSRMGVVPLRRFVRRKALMEP